MSRPRAAMSVATSTRTLPSRKSASARLRAPWLLSPWMATVSRPSFCIWWASLSAICLVRTNTNTRCQLPRPIMWESSSRRRSRSTWMMRWVTCSAAVLLGSTSIRVGSFSRSSASALMSSEKVAEKSRVCRSAGSAFMMRRMSWIKPISSMRSASSSTSTSSSFRVRAPWVSRSSKRPGVATRMSMPSLMASRLGLMLTPP